MTSEEFRTNPMFLRNQFKGDRVFEIPKIEKEEIELENIELIGYDRLGEKETDKIVHLFLDDYKFEAIWNDPEPRVEKLKKYKAVLATNYRENQIHFGFVLTVLHKAVQLLFQLWVLEKKNHCLCKVITK